ncbi:MAG: GntR family transcriptional regulator [Terracidiphilus sp.]|jgi:GntR family transcriptional regulator
MHSNIVISQADGRPMYLQIMEQVKRLVAVGEWAPGDEIPSIRQLAISLRVSAITIKRAYLELEREGVILTQQGKGSVIAPNPDLGSHLYQEELSEHLEKAAELGDLLGLSSDEIARRMKEASSRLSETRLTKEIV